jgi:ABC-type transporter Mla maintaining outer membrane lipid asymmetry ATPase subunit MlaF
MSADATPPGLPPTPRAEEPGALELQDVTVTTSSPAERVALEGVSWRVGRGEFWVIGGPPESGKSHFMATAAGLKPPGKGRVRLLGHDVAELAEAELTWLRLRVAFVFENGGRLFDEMTVRDNIALPLHYHGSPDGSDPAMAVARLLDKLELEPFADRTPQQLPYGWRHRAALGRALALDPELLFLDNPLSRLDPAHGRWWRGFLEQWACGLGRPDGQPATLILSSDEIQPWAGADRRFAVLGAGRWQAFGPWADLARGADPALREALGLTD